MAGALVSAHDREQSIKTAAAAASHYCQRRTCEELDGLARLPSDEEWTDWVKQITESVDEISST